MMVLKYYSYNKSNNNSIINNDCKNNLLDFPDNKL